MHFVLKCVCNNRKRAKFCVQQKWNPFWTFFVVYLCYPWYICYKTKFLLFFLIFVTKWNFRVHYVTTSIFTIHISFLPYQPVKVYRNHLQRPFFVGTRWPRKVRFPIMDSISGTTLIVPYNGKFMHIFNRNDCSDKIYGYNFCCLALFWVYKFKDNQTTKCSTLFSKESPKTWNNLKSRLLKQKI